MRRSRPWRRESSAEPCHAARARTRPCETCPAVRSRSRRRPRRSRPDRPGVRSASRPPRPRSFRARRSRTRSPHHASRVGFELRIPRPRADASQHLLAPEDVALAALPTSVVDRTTSPASQRPGSGRCPRVGWSARELHVVRDRRAARGPQAVDQPPVQERGKGPALLELVEGDVVDLDDDDVGRCVLNAADREPRVDAVELEPIKRRSRRSRARSRPRLRRHKQRCHSRPSPVRP